MSELKLVSPLLDGFVMGDPISDRDGVRCCPAMRENSDDKYIVKIISVPASQKQLDALLLTGAYKDSAAAAEYFKSLAEDTVKEVRLLQQLAKLEGFLPYEGWQIVPMEGNELGYDVYLLGSYKRSLESYLRRNTMTHLSAVNLGIDLCAALSLCRRAGFIYTDLKPSNVFLSGQREYRIGDLGFAKLSAMKYTSMPGKYVSRYTPPELHDPLATLNPTVDTYAVGIILYQIYNNGELPFAVKAPLKYLPTPLNADYEMAEIIQKACDPNPRKRYQTPAEMGQALVNYMQRNCINDIPIVPPTAQNVSAQAAPEEAVPAEDSAVAITEDAAIAETVNPAASQPEELHFMEHLVSDDTAPGADEADDLMDTPMSDEVDRILAQADELISHELDLTVDVEEPEVETVETEPEEPAEAPAAEPEEAQAESDAAPEETDGDVADFELPVPVATVAAEDDLDFGFPLDVPMLPVEEETTTDKDSSVAVKPRKKRGWIGIVIFLLILALLGGSAYYYYENYYLLPIDNMEINGHEDTITVKITTDVDETLLKVVCTDTYGNKQEKAVSGGQVVFADLNADTMYKITVETEGFHKLTGSCTGSYATAVETSIVDFTAKTGSEDGSVILNFTVDGPETQEWVVEYTAEGEEIISLPFTGHRVTINDLTVGKVYTFTLQPGPDMYLVGNTSLEYLATKIIVAEDLAIVSCDNGVLTASWTGPEDATVENWTVRCYSDAGFDETITVTEPGAEFSGISADNAYTVEVTAAGMSQSARAFVTANPATVTDVQVKYDAETGLALTWKSESAPEGGWLVMYSVDGSDTTEMAECTGTTAVVRNVISKATYSFQIKAADGSTVFGGTAEFEGVEVPAFNKYGLAASTIQSSLCHTPDKENWNYKDVKDSDYTTSYTSGEKASLVLYTYSQFYLKTDETSVMFVIRNEDGKVIPSFTRTMTKVWRELWPDDGKYCYLDIPVMPTVDGKYSLEVYFNGHLVLTKKFSIITANG